jgi:hypothetical protein
MPAPGVSDDVGTLDSDPVEDSHGVRNVGLNVEWSRRSRGSESALLIAVDSERIFEFTHKWLGVVRETRAAVEHQDWRS